MWSSNACHWKHILNETNTSMSSFSLNFRTPFCTPISTLKSSTTLLFGHSTNPPPPVHLMYIIYANASNTTPLYTHIISHVVWRVHPSWLISKLNQLEGSIVKCVFILGKISEDPTQRAGHLTIRNMSKSCQPHHIVTMMSHHALDNLERNYRYPSCNAFATWMAMQIY